MAQRGGTDLLFSAWRHLWHMSRHGTQFIAGEIPETAMVAANKSPPSSACKCVSRAGAGPSMAVAQQRPVEGSASESRSEPPPSSGVGALARRLAAACVPALGPNLCLQTPVSRARTGPLLHEMAAGSLWPSGFLLRIRCQASRPPSSGDRGRACQLYARRRKNLRE